MLPILAPRTTHGPFRCFVSHCMITSSNNLVAPQISVLWTPVRHATRLWADVLQNQCYHGQGGLRLLPIRGSVIQCNIVKLPLVLFQSLVGITLGGFCNRIRLVLPAVMELCRHQSGDIQTLVAQLRHRFNPATFPSRKQKPPSFELDMQTDGIPRTRPSHESQTEGDLSIL
jgi:hypothetical protein